MGLLRCAAHRTIRTHRNIFQIRPKVYSRPSAVSKSTTASSYYHEPGEDDPSILRRSASVMEDRVARGKLPHMQQVFENLTKATRPQIRAALLYWMSKPVQDLAMHQPLLFNDKKPLDIATSIVDQLHVRFRNAPNENARKEAAKDLEYVLLGSNSGESCNNILTRLIVSTLQPLQSTFAWLKQTGARQVFSAKENVQHLCTASRLFDLLQYLHDDDNYFAKFHPDHLSLQTHLNLIGKRTKFLVFCFGPQPFTGRFPPRTRRGVQWTAESTAMALGGQDITVKGLIESAIRAVRESKVPLGTVHYTILASLYADASLSENGMADAAVDLLTDCPTIPSIFNPVLLAYTREADRHHEASRHAAALHARTQCETVFTQIRQPDAVSYSILLKLYKHQPETAQKVLDKLREPALIHFNAVLDAWAKAGQSEPAKSLLRRMEALKTVDRISYTTALKACNRSEEVKELLDRCVGMDDPACRPDPIMYTTVFSSYFGKLKAAPKRKGKHAVAEEMRELLEHLLNCSHFQSVVGSSIYKYYNSVFRAWAYVGTRASVKQSLELLETMIARGVTPNGQTYQNLLASVAYGGDVTTSARIFHSMEEQGIPRTTTAVVGYLRQLIAQCKSYDEFGMRVLERLSVQNDDSFKVGPVFEGLFEELTKEPDTRKKIVHAERIESLFRYLQEHSDHEALKAPYNECFRAWAFSLSAEAEDRAFGLLEEMKHREELPDNKTYEYILTCFSRNPTKKAVERARFIISEMDSSNVPITLSILNCFLRVLVRSGSKGSLQEAEALVDSIEKGMGTAGIVPNMTSYEIVLQGFLRSGNLEKADCVLTKMEQFASPHRPEIKPTATMRLQMMSLWAESLSEVAMERVEHHFNAVSQGGKPTSEMYASLQRAWCKSKRKEAPSRVESILVRMQSDFESGLNPLCQPKLENFNAVIACLASEGDAERAEAVLIRMKELSKSSKYADLAPSTASYESVIRGWAQSSNKDAGQRALRLLNSVKQAWESQKGSPPNAACYNSVLEATGRSSDENKTQQCYFLLKEMIASSQSGKNRLVAPTHASFLHVLRACSTSSSSDIALNVVMGAMEDYLVLFSRRASVDVFVQFLYAIFRLAPQGKTRDKAILHVLLDDQCPDDIILNSTIRDAVAKSVSPDGQESLRRKYGNRLSRNTQGGRTKQGAKLFTDCPQSQRFRS